MFHFFRKKSNFDDAKKSEFVDLIATLLTMQTLIAQSSIIDDQGRLKRKALGYVYGFIDAALRTIGQDMSNISVSVPITCNVINKLWPDHVPMCMDYIIKHAADDPILTLGMMRGGQQYLDMRKPGAKGTPMGLGIFLVEGDKE